MQTASTTATQSACASAPGKVILFGEHAVVYGEPAVAAALSDLRIFVLVTTTNTQSLHVEMLDLPEPIDVRMDAERIVCSLESLQAPPTKACAERIRNLLVGFSNNDLNVEALTPLIYLIRQLLPVSMIQSGLDVRVRSRDLPLGAGLGSSAAFSVACAAALVKLASQSETLGRPDPMYFEQIDQYAFYSEILLHGTPSGIDNAVSARGGALLYTKKKDGDSQMESIPNLPDMHLMVVDTKVPRSTRELVAGVRALYDRHPSVIRPILQSMGEIATSFVKNGVSDVLTLVNVNHLLLRAVGVSHATLDEICETVARVAPNQAAAKLTGAGGGGCAFVLFRPDLEGREYVMQRISKSLQYKCFSSSVGGDGVLWLSPDKFPVTEEKDSSIWNERYSLLAATATVAALSWLLLRRSR